MMISCSCGTKLRVEASAAGKIITCPKCQKKLRVPGGAPKPTPSKAPARPAAPGPPSAVPVSAAPQPAPAGDRVLNCACGQKMKVSASHAGKTVACPKCKRQMKVPGAPAAVAPVTPVQPATPVTPVAPVAAAPVQAAIPVTPVQAAMPVAPAQPVPAQPDLFGAAPNPYATPGAASGMPPGGMPAYQSGPPRKKRRSGSGNPVGILVAMIGVCIMTGAFGLCCIGLASQHIYILTMKSASSSARSSTSMPSFTPGMSAEERVQQMNARMEEQKARMEEARQRRESSKTYADITKYCMKIGRPILAVGSIVATVGYGLSIASAGAQMGLAIAALVVGAIGTILDIVLRMIPWLVEKKAPHDLFLMNFGSSIFSSGSDRALGTIGIEVLMSAHLILFSIFALVGFYAKKRNEGSGLAITAISVLGGYIVMVIVIWIMIENASLSETFIYVLMTVYWITNICLLTGFGFLISALARLRS